MITSRATGYAKERTTTARVIQLRRATPLEGFGSALLATEALEPNCVIAECRRCPYHPLGILACSWLVMLGSDSAQKATTEDGTAERDAAPPAAKAGGDGGFYIPSLDGIRAVSFFTVFLAHAGLGRFIPGYVGSQSSSF